MNLQDITQDIFLLIIEHLIKIVGPVKALRLRLVSQKFNHVILYLVCTPRWWQNRIYLYKRLTPTLKARVLLAGSRSRSPHMSLPFKAIFWVSSELARLTQASEDQAQKIHIKLATAASEAGNRSSNIIPWGGFENTRFQNLLCGAIIIGDLPLFVYLLPRPEDGKKTVGINKLSHYFGMPLHLAAAWGHKHIVEYLLTNGADAQRIIGAHANDNDWNPNVHDVCLWSADVYHSAEGSALRAAALSGYEEIVRLLLSPKYCLRIETAEYYRVILAATRGGHITIINLLLETANKTITDLGRFRQQMLHEAVRHKREEIVRLLLRFETNVNFLHDGVNGNVYLPRRTHGAVLHTAAAHNYVDIMQIVLDAGANTQLRSPNKMRPIETAAMAGHEEAVDLLLKYSPDVQLDRQRAFLCAATGGQTWLMRRFLEKGELNLKDKNRLSGYGTVGREALKHGIAMENLDIITLLLDAGVPINSDDPDETRSPFYAGAMVIKDWIVSHLTQLGMREINTSYPYQQTWHSWHDPIMRNWPFLPSKDTWRWVGKY